MDSIISTFVLSPSSDATPTLSPSSAPPPPPASFDDALIARALSLIPAPVSVPDFVADLGAFLTSADGAERRRAMTLLAAVLEGLCARDPLRVWSARDPASALVTFCAERFGDYPSLLPALRGARALLDTFSRASADEAPSGTALRVIRALDAELHTPSADQPTRAAVYSLFEYVCSTPAHAASFCGDGDADGGAADEVASAFVKAMDGERDPRCLIGCMSAARALLAAMGARLSAPVLAEVFDVVACYFPITFTPPPNDRVGITQAALVASLRAVFCASPAIAPHALPLLLEKMDAPLAATKRDALATLSAVARAAGGDVLAPFAVTIAGALRVEIASGAPASVEPDAPWAAAARTAGDSGSTVGSTLDVAADFSYWGGGNKNAVDDALGAVTAVTAALSASARTPSAVSAWTDWTALVGRGATTDAERAGADAPRARTAARLLSAFACGSAAALSAAGACALTAARELLADARAHGTPAPRVAALSLIASVCAAISSDVGFVDGAHPLNAGGVAAGFADILVEQIEIVVDSEETADAAPRLLRSGAPTATEAVCLSVAALRALAARAPTPVLSDQMTARISSASARFVIYRDARADPAAAATLWLLARLLHASGRTGAAARAAALPLLTEALSGGQRRAHMLHIFSHFLAGQCRDVVNILLPDVLSLLADSGAAPMALAALAAAARAARAGAAPLLDALIPSLFLPLFQPSTGNSLFASGSADAFENSATLCALARTVAASDGERSAELFASAAATFDGPPFSDTVDYILFLRVAAAVLGVGARRGAPAPDPALLSQLSTRALLANGDVDAGGSLEAGNTCDALAAALGGLLNRAPAAAVGDAARALLSTVVALRDAAGRALTLPAVTVAAWVAKALAARSHPLASEYVGLLLSESRLGEGTPRVRARLVHGLGDLLAEDIPASPLARSSGATLLPAHSQRILFLYFGAAEGDGATADLLWGLCAGLSRAPRALITAFAPRLVPIVVRAIALSTTGGAGGRTDFDEIARFEVLRALGAVSAVALGELAPHALALVPALLALATKPASNGGGRPATRAAAIDSLRALTALPFLTLRPLRERVVGGLVNALDDPRRAVRRRAAACRNEWATIK